MVVKYEQTLLSLLENNLGLITTKQAYESGVNRVAFANFVKRQGLERLSKGIYVDPESLHDEMVLLQIRFPKVIFSHETALYLHDLTDAEPLKTHVSVPSNYNATSLKTSGVDVCFVKPSWFELGLTVKELIFGFSVRTYDKERTICDLVRRRETIEVAIFNQAIRNFARSKDKNLNALSKYAQMMHIEKKIREIMEVAL